MKAINKIKKHVTGEKVATAAGVYTGFETVTALVTVLGIPGTSAAGITSALAAIGSIVGGGMMAGISVCAAIPVAGAGAGYGVYKGGKALYKKAKPKVKDFKETWDAVKKKRPVMS